MEQAREERRKNTTTDFSLTDCLLGLSRSKIVQSQIDSKINLQLIFSRAMDRYLAKNKGEQIQ